MIDKRKVLVADSDRETLYRLQKGLVDSFDVIIARDGSRALELAITEYPDLIIFYRYCPLIGAKQFLRILRSNPRTENIPLIILSDDPVSSATLPGYLDGVMVKPLNSHDVAGHLRSVFNRVDAVRQVGQQRGEVRGSTTQISTVDLLQVFAAGRRSGCIHIEGGARDERGEIFLTEGRVEDARIGLIQGEKALYRMLSWDQGTFSFVPGMSTSALTIFAEVDALLLEGLRQVDELRRLRELLPARDSEIRRLMVLEELPSGLHPATSEVLGLLDHCRKVGSLIDRAQATDLDVMLALRFLVGHHIVRIVESAAEQEEESASLVSQDEVFDILGRLRRAALPRVFLYRPKLAIVCSDTEQLHAIVNSLSHVAEFHGYPLDGFEHDGFRRLGVLELGGGFEPELCAFAASERLLPLAFALSAGTVAGIVVGPIDASLRRLIAMLVEERRVALVWGRGPHDNADGFDVAHVVNMGHPDEASVRELLCSALDAINVAELREVRI